MATRLATCLVVGWGLLCATPAAGQVLFTEVSEEAGVRFTHDPLGFIDAYGNPLQNGVGSGAAWIDLNRDGWLDLIVSNGTTPGNFCYMNNADGTFTDVSEKVGIRTNRVGNGFAVADVDNDGNNDLFLANHMAEPDLFRGTRFSTPSQSNHFGLRNLFFPSGQEPIGWDGPLSMGAAFADYDKDGFVDVYMANFLFADDVLLRNINGTRFENTGKIRESVHGYGCQPIWLDYDGDRDMDVFVINDLGVDFLFRNEGRQSGWTFTDVAQKTRIAGGYDSSRPLSMGMGGVAADFDQDLDLDIYVTNFRHNALWLNPGDWSEPGTAWTNVAPERGVDFALNSWGTDFFDVENDGDLDLIMIGGWVEGGPDVQPHEITNKLWLNNGPPNWDFTDVTGSSGMTDTQFGRSQAVGDYDRDGDLDVFITNVSYYDPAPDGVTPPIEHHTLLYRNDTANQGNWISLLLQGQGVHGDGSGCNRSAIGAKVLVTADGKVQMSVVDGGSGFMGQNSYAQEFGLGEATTVTRVRVEWMCGGATIVRNVPVNQAYRVVEGETELRLAPVAIDRMEGTGITDGIQIELWTPPSHVWMETQVWRSSEELGESLAQTELELDLIDGHGIVLDPNVEPGVTYAYRFVMKDDLGNTTSAAPLYVMAKPDEEEPQPQLPASVVLGQNFPNPFNPVTNIQFAIPREMEVELTLYDAAGRVVRELYHDTPIAGEHTVTWDGRDDAGGEVSSGVYYYTLRTDDASYSRKLVVVR